MKKYIIHISIVMLVLLPFISEAQNQKEYDGDWVNDQKHGQGTCTYYDGSTYQGPWINNMRSGQGTLTWSNGDQYVGTFVNDQMNGTGVMTYKNGEKYEGNFAASQRSGKGTMTYKDGSVYVGNWVNDARNGQGELTLSNGDKYSGSFIADKMAGQGIMTYANGSVYTGQFTDNERSGQGAMNFSNGDQYNGAWGNDKRNGLGKIVYANGDVYDGAWKNDRPWGLGVMDMTNGDKYSGEFSKGEFDGKGKFTQSSGMVYHGNFNKGLQDGEGIMWLPNGDQYEGGFNNGIMDGKGTYFYANGEYYKGEFKKGGPEGMGSLYADNGDMIKGGKWKGGSLVRTWEQIQAGRKALAEGLQALAQGMQQAYSQSQAMNQQMKQQAAQNKAQSEAAVQQMLQAYKQKNPTTTTTGNNNGYPILDPYAARYANQSGNNNSGYYTQNMNQGNNSGYPTLDPYAQRFKQQQTGNTNQPTNYGNTNTRNNNYSNQASPVNYGTTGSGPSVPSANYNAPNPAQRSSLGYNTNTSSGTHKLIATYYKSNSQMKMRCMAMLDEYGEVKTDYINQPLVDGWKETWRENGEKMNENFYEKGILRESFYWNKYGSIDGYSVYDPKDDRNERTLLDAEWEYHKNSSNYKSIYVRDVSGTEWLVECRSDGTVSKFDYDKDDVSYDISLDRMGRRARVEAYDVLFMGDRENVSVIYTNSKVSKEYTQYGSLYYENGQIVKFTFYHKNMDNVVNFKGGNPEFDLFIDKEEFKRRFPKHQKVAREFMPMIQDMENKGNQVWGTYHPDQFKPQNRN